MISTVTYNGDGATRVFPVAFEIRGEDYVVVFIDGVGVSDRSKYDIINNSIVFRVGDEPVTGTNNVEIVVATSPTEIADLNAPPSGIQTVLENLPDIVLVAEQVVPNLPEILLADNNAATATAQAGIATTQAGIATTKASEASTSAGNALTSENNAESAEANALSYKNSAESARDIAVASKDTAVTKASEASTSATQALGYRNEAEVFRDEAEGFALSIDPSKIVHKTGDETIAGVKTFSSSPIVPTPTAGDNSTKIATTAFVKAKSELDSIGVGQTWQNVTASRASGVTYTNSTGKPIMIFVSTNSVVSGGSLTPNVNGVNIGIAACSDASETMNLTVSFIVPNGNTYIITVSGHSINNWSELR